MPRMVGTSKPSRVDELVSAVSGSAWQPESESAQVLGFPTPPWFMKKSRKPRLALMDVLAARRRSRAGG